MAMSPRQYVVVENKALRQFAQRYGYCLSPAALAREAEMQLRTEGADLEGMEMTLRSGQLALRLKRRGNQWFITEIDRRQ